MLTNGEMSELLYHKRLKEYGLSEKYFFSLPYECQQAILMAGFNEKHENKKRRENFQKRMALKQYLFEENIKERVLKLIKKNK